MDWFKAIVSAVLGAVTSIFGALAVPILILVGCNVVDVSTGLMAAPNRGQKWQSALMANGIKKKVCLWLLVFVGWLLDMVVSYTAEQLGWAIPIDYLISAVVAVWLICTEILSILENVTDIGAPVPQFMQKLVTLIKGKAESTADIATDITETDKEKDDGNKKTTG